MAEKLNSMRLLERERIAYRGLEYPASEAADAVAVARLIGVPPETVLKTLVVVGASHNRPLLVMIPAPASLDLKQLAAEIGQKRLTMASQREAEALTGLQVGGIGALALAAKRWPCYVAQSAAAHALICVSAGRRGLMLQLAPADLVRVLGAQWVLGADDGR